MESYCDMTKAMINSWIFPRNFSFFDAVILTLVSSAFDRAC